MFSKFFDWFKRHKILSFLLVFVVVITLLVIGINAWDEYSYKKLETTVSEISIPSDWALIESRRSGNSICIDLCRTAARSYDVSIGNDEAPSVLKSIISNSGFEVTSEDSVCESPANVTGNIIYCAFEGESSENRIRIVYYPDDKNEFGKEVEIVGIAVSEKP